MHGMCALIMHSHCRSNYLGPVSSERVVDTRFGRNKCLHQQWAFAKSPLAPRHNRALWGYFRGCV